MLPRYSFVTEYTLLLRPLANATLSIYLLMSSLYEADIGWPGGLQLSAGAVTTVLTQNARFQSNANNSAKS